MESLLWDISSLTAYSRTLKRRFPASSRVWISSNLHCDSCCPVTQSCPTLCDSMDCSTPGFSVLHYLLESAQTHVCWVCDVVQPSHPLLPPSPPALSLSQHQGLFQWVGSSHQVAKELELQLQHQSFQWIFRVDFLEDCLVWSPCSPRDSQETSLAQLCHPLIHDCAHPRWSGSHPWRKGGPTLHPLSQFGEKKLLPTSAILIFFRVLFLLTSPWLLRSSLRIILYWISLWSMSLDWTLADTGLVPRVVPVNRPTKMGFGDKFSHGFGAALNTLSMENGMLVIYHIKWHHN